MGKGKTKEVNLNRITIEMVLLLPEGMCSADLIAAMANALEALPGGEQIKIEKLKYDPG